ncbi:phosphatase PAP2 family protein [Clostridium sp.]|uniref:phosphatase PAP2 family protein n=1 Tax=Clostridium sp. TaxID=1506 RepID=UPI00345BDBEC
MMSLLQRFDDSILLFVKYNMHGIIMDKIMVISTYLGNNGIIWIIIALVLICNHKYRKVGFMALAALILSGILGDEILKNVFRRARPLDTISTMNILIPRPLSYSFPSGHTMSSFAVAGVLGKCFKKYAIEFISLASLIAFSRVYLYVHYPTDVLAGAILGLMCSAIVIYLFNKLDHKSKASI